MNSFKIYGSTMRTHSSEFFLLTFDIKKWKIWPWLAHQFIHYVNATAGLCLTSYNSALPGHRGQLSMENCWWIMIGMVMYTGVNHVVHTVQCFFQFFNKGIKSIQCTKVHYYLVCS